LERLVPPNIDKKNGRPGMDLWKVFVMGTLRLNLNWDYDRVHDMVNNHKTIREMLGHDWEEDDYKYNLQTIKDNLALFTVEILDEINQLVVKAGHKVLKKNEETILKGRCDSFVVETNVHYPTDCNLLLDAMRKVITLTADASFECLLAGWRNYRLHIKHLKRLCRTTQEKALASLKTKEAKEERKKEVVQLYLDEAQKLLQKAKTTLLELKTYNLVGSDAIEGIEFFISDAFRQIDQIERRIFKGETIPHQEKVFSLFERHTEWIVRGKAGVKQELGLRTCFVEDQFGFILYHEVMKQITDKEIAVKMVEESQKRFPNLRECSFDKGFYSRKNKQKLKEKLAKLVMPKNGKRSEEEEAYENSEEFRDGKRRHASVESGVHGLVKHGMKRCRDKGEEHFKVYVALGMVARNLQKVGALLQKAEKKKQQRMQRRSAA